MDELIIGEDKYVSSKRAAEITGYAKDYIGQLCREGRVEARLVGRNWYVLESSLKDHRFGGSDKKADVPPADPQKAVAGEWESPRYEAEEVTPVPLTAEFELEEEGQPDEVHHVTQMQEAWKDWFDTQKPRIEKEEVQEPQNGGEVPVSIIREVAPEPEQTRIVREEVRPRGTRGSSALFRAIFVGLAILALSVTYIGSGLLPVQNGNSWSAAVINALGGSREYSK